MKTFTTLTIALAAGAVIGAAATERDYIRDTADRATVVMPYCATEDGSDYPDRHCLWVDPVTGDGYVNAYSPAASLTRGGK